MPLKKHLRSVRSGVNYWISVKCEYAIVLAFSVHNQDLGYLDEAVCEESDVEVTVNNKYQAVINSSDLLSPISLSGCSDRL